MTNVTLAATRIAGLDAPSTGSLPYFSRRLPRNENARFHISGPLKTPFLTHPIMPELFAQARLPKALQKNLLSNLPLFPIYSFSRTAVVQG